MADMAKRWSLTEVGRGETENCNVSWACCQGRAHLVNIQDTLLQKARENEMSLSLAAEGEREMETERKRKEGGRNRKKCVVH